MSPYEETVWLVAKHHKLRSIGRFGYKETCDFLNSGRTEVHVEGRSALSKLTLTSLNYMVSKS